MRKWGTGWNTCLCLWCISYSMCFLFGFTVDFTEDLSSFVCFFIFFAHNIFHTLMLHERMTGRVCLTMTIWQRDKLKLQIFYIHFEMRYVYEIQWFHRRMVLIARFRFFFFCFSSRFFVVKAHIRSLHIPFHFPFIHSFT